MIQRLNRLCHQHARHLVLAAVIISSTFLFGTFTAWTRQPVKAAAISKDVLVIHGMNGYNTSASSQYYGYDCTGTADPNGDDLEAAENGNGSPGDAVNVLHANGWNAVSIGYYADPNPQSSLQGTPQEYQNGDFNCSGYLASESSHCTGVPVGTQGSNNEDLRHLGCELAWYIYDNYSSKDEEVRVLAHSMGGLIIRWALYKNQFQSNPSTYDPNYPHYVYVPAVVTLGTPHGGVTGAGLTAFGLGLCDQCLQAGQMDPSDSANFLQLMMQNGLNPQGSTGTIWSNIGSADDEALTEGGVNPSNYVSAFDMESQNKYVYSYTDPQATGSTLAYFPDYTHGGLFGDESPAQDAQIKACVTSCDPAIEAAVKNYPLLSSQFHALTLSAHLLDNPPPQIPPPPTPTPRPPTPTPTPAPPPACSPVCTNVGAGYNTTDWYVPSQVRAQFVVPRLSGADKSDMSMWIGFNNDPTHSGPGQAGGYAVRMGIDGQFDDVGDLTYYAFWSVQQVTGVSHNTSTGVWSSTTSWLEGNTVLYQVNPGDKVGMTIWFSGSTVYFDFADLTQNTGTIRNHSTTTPGFTVYSANWMVSNQFDPNLANWSNSGFSFTNCQIDVNGTWEPITYNHYNQTALTTSTGKKLATSGGLGSGATSFGVTFNAAH